MPANREWPDDAAIAAALAQAPDAWPDNVVAALHAAAEASPVVPVPPCPKCEGTGIVFAGRERCGLLMVGSGTDTYDPTCELSRGHDGPCRSTSAIDQHKLTAVPPGPSLRRCDACDGMGRDRLIPESEIRAALDQADRALLPDLVHEGTEGFGVLAAIDYLRTWLDERKAER